MGVRRVVQNQISKFHIVVFWYPNRYLKFHINQISENLFWSQSNINLIIEANIDHYAYIGCIETATPNVLNIMSSKL